MTEYKKRKIIEKEAAALFIRQTEGFIKTTWDKSLAVKIEETLNLDKNLKEDIWSLFYFTYAFIAFEIIRLFDLLPKEQALRLRNNIYQSIPYDDLHLKYEALDTLNKFEKVILEYPDYSKGFPIKTNYQLPPLKHFSEAIGVGLADLLNIDQTIEVDGKHIYSILIISTLGAVLLLLSKDWNWQKFSENIQLIEK